MNSTSCFTPTLHRPSRTDFLTLAVLFYFNLVFVMLFIFRVEKLTGLPREIVEGAESLQVSLSTTHPNIMIFHCFSTKRYIFSF